MRQIILASLAVAVTQVVGVLGQNIPACIPTCQSNVQANPAALGCTSGDDAACMCKASGFFEGITACSAPSCAASADQVASFLNGAFCQAFPVGVAAEPSAQPSSAPVSTTDAPVSSSSSIAPASTSESAPTSTSSNDSSASSIVSSTSSAPSASSTTVSSTSTSSAPASSSVSSTTQGSSSNPASITATSTVAASATASSVEDPEGQNENKSGLSNGAVIGIGIAGGAVGLAIMGLIAWMCLRRRSQTQQRPAPAMQISNPLPGSGRTAASPDPGSYEKYGNDEFEMHANRYEDMPPRQTPRTMV